MTVQNAFPKIRVIFEYKDLQRTPPSRFSLFEGYFTYYVSKSKILVILKGFTKSSLALYAYSVSMGKQAHFITPGFLMWMWNFNKHMHNPLM